MLGGDNSLTKNILADTVQNLKVYDISKTLLKQVESTPGVEIERNLLTSELLDVRFEAFYCNINLIQTFFSCLKIVKML